MLVQDSFAMSFLLQKGSNFSVVWGTSCSRALFGRCANIERSGPCSGGALVSAGSGSLVAAVLVYIIAVTGGTGDAVTATSGPPVILSLPAISLLCCAPPRPSWPDLPPLYQYPDLMDYDEFPILFSFQYIETLF